MAFKADATRPRLDLRDREALLTHNPAPQEVIDEARAIKERVLLAFGLGDSTIASWLYSKCHYHIPTTARDTMAVTIGGDGTGALLYNPQFTCDLGEDGATFVLFHEARHVMQRHLFVDPVLNADPMWRLASEATINHVAMVRLKRTGLPEVPERDPETGEVVIDPKTGQPKMVKTGIDPKEVHRQYAKNLKDQGLEPVDYASFIRTDYGCYTELLRMSKPPKQNASMGMACIHQEGDGEEDTDGLTGGVQMDQETVDEIAAQVIHNTMQAAKAGKEAARAELLELGERTEDANERTKKLWGLYGLNSLRGETQATRRVEWWKQWLQDTLASKLEEGERLIYPKKRGAVNLVLGLDPMLARRGEEEIKRVLFAADGSASMYPRVMEWLAKLVGHTDGVEAVWLAFDGIVTLFKPGEPIRGGGGTNFQNVVDYAEGRLEVDGKRNDEPFDAVVMFTDGGAAPVTVQEPEKWIWLITEGGSPDVPETHNPPMAWHFVTTGDGVD